MKYKRVVIKVGTSTLTHKTGKLNIKILDNLAYVLSDLKNMGMDVVLVTSGAIGVGAKKLGLNKRPDTVKLKQASAAVGQCELMYLYDKFFSEYNQVIAQILLTKNSFSDKEKYQNVYNTFDALFDAGAIPIVNENDTVATDELKFGDNDTLGATVAKLTNADLLIILTDTNGLYDSDPNKNKNAKLLSEVSKITPDIEKMAGGVVSNVGTGGMTTKISAAKIATNAGITTVVTNGKNPKDIYKIIEGKNVGTTFIKQ